MKPLIQKLPLTESTSFIAKTFRTPHFEVGWHQHIEYELILFTEGTGLSFVGNHVGEFETGDIYFFAANLPHTFQKRDPESIAGAVVVQFREDFWGKDMLALPELRGIRLLFEHAKQGLKLGRAITKRLKPLIQQLETSSGFQRILLLGECLNRIAGSSEYTALSTQDIRTNKDERLDKVFQFTIDRYPEPVRLSQVAAIACMSIPSFCEYFKRCTKKTYIDFLNEVRVGYACNMLMETDKPVIDICFAVGYNTLANFHKQFLRIKRKTPLQFRKNFKGRNA